ncbi:MAG: NADH-quinone oxidoreductase subunit H [bacterium]
MQNFYFFFAVAAKSMCFLLVLFVASFIVAEFKNWAISFISGRKYIPGIKAAVVSAVKPLFQPVVPADITLSNFSYLTAVFSIVPAILLFAIIPFGPTVLNLSDLHPGLASFPLQTVADIENGIVFLFVALQFLLFSPLLTETRLPVKNIDYYSKAAILKPVFGAFALVLLIMTLVISTQTFNLSGFVTHQTQHPWLAFQQPLTFFLFVLILFCFDNNFFFGNKNGFIRSFQKKTAANDSAAKNIIKLARNIRLLGCASLVTLFFWGGWRPPFAALSLWELVTTTSLYQFLAPPFWFFFKTLLFIYCFIWLKINYPVNNELSFVLIWRLILPLTVVNLFFNSIFSLIYAGPHVIFILQVILLVALFLGGRSKTKHANQSVTLKKRSHR